MGLRLASRIRRLRGRHLLLVDSVGIVLASVIALSFRYDPITAASDFWALLPGLLLLQLAVRTPLDIAMGLYQRDWRHASVSDLRLIASAAFIGSAICASIVFASIVLGARALPWVPRGYWPIELFLTMAVLGGSRLLIRSASDHLSVIHGRAAAVGVAAPTLLYGAGRVGVLMARSAQRNHRAGVRPVGFLDDDRLLHGTRVADLRVLGGLDDMEAAVRATGATALLITMPSAKGPTVRRVVETAMGLGLEVRTVPALEQLMDGTIDAHRARRVNVEDLLRRPMATEHSPSVAEMITDRVVLITGAAGSIGSELARQVHAMKPRRLILLDRAESPLYLVQRDLEERAAHGRGGGQVSPRLGNVVSRAAMQRLIAEERPHVVFHAAAYKHVPMLECHPEDAVQVNVAGTLSVLDAAIANDVARFVLVSTDKAVRPSSVMGASKRIAEMLVLDAARRTGLPYVAVRFGNVLGSAGSVVPIFQEQLEQGRPLTVTHPEMTRYFMTIPEASWLILDAAAMGQAGDLFVLDMGDPVLVMDLARDVARLAGRDPDAQPIQIMGLRPGEKLHEELFYTSERVEPTDTPKVLRAQAELPPADIRDRVRELIVAASTDPSVALGDQVHAVARASSADSAPAVPVAGPLGETTAMVALLVDGVPVPDDPPRPSKEAS